MGRTVVIRVLVGLGLATGAPACGDGPTDIPTNEIPAGDFDAAWSPDGQWIAFSHEDSLLETEGLYVARIDGTERRLVARGGWGADWSPDGSRLLLGVGYTYQVYVLDLISGSVTQLTDSGFFNVPGAWSPDGQTIAFGSDGDYGGGDPGLWLMQADGSRPRRMPFERGADPDWAPSGDKLVTGGAYFTTPPELVHRLVVNDTLGADTVWLTPPTFNADQPAWSPTGEWIAYVRELGPRQAIHLVHPDGTGDHLLVSGGSYPSWSPDGQRVVFNRYAGGVGAIWCVDLNGQNLQQLSWPRPPTP